ncbi:MAG: glycoside hydrolase domain-containing protein [Chitinophagaceae bacterium]
MIYKRTALFVAMSFFLTAAHAQPGRIDSAMIAKPAFHFLPEYTFDVPASPASWKDQKPGMHVAFGSTDEVYFRREVPALQNETRVLETTGWKGERINAMILVWSADTVNQVRFTWSDLKNAKGNVISKKDMQLHMIRYVISNYPYDAREVSCGEGPVDKAWLMPDRFEAFDRFDVPGETVRPVWLSINIPSSTVPGTYNGKIEVVSDKGTTTLDLKIKVQDHVLPRPHDWTFRLDLWQNPWVIAEYYHVKPWSAEHMILLEKHLKLYAEAGGKFITTYAVHSPWSDNSYMIEGAMIEWIKRKNGSWKFDYSIFDQYVQLCMKTGIDKAITIYTPIPWGERFRYLDEATGSYVYERWLPTTDTFKTNWNVFLTDLKIHLEKKGWFNKTYIGINENAMEQTLSAIKVVKEHSAKWKITYAGDWHQELDALLDDYSCVYGKEPGINDVQKRSSRKFTSTYYICCTPAKPNTFVFSPPVEGRWLGWYALAHGYDGLLRWAYDAWPADPVRDARHLLWPAGDCFMVYPGAASGIHFEKMREGIADYEKMKILLSKATNSPNAKVKQLAKDLEAHLLIFVNESEFKSEKLQSDIEKGRMIIEALGDMLSKPAVK